MAMDSFLYLFSGFRWQDGLDILLNTYILFRLYVLFRGTNVFRGLLGIAALWGAGQAAQSLGLIVTNWAMQGIIAVAAVIVIVVFRNEISNALQARDLKSFFWGIPRYQHHTPLDDIAQSVRDLAAKRIGALIVLPLKQGLDTVVQGGVRLDSRLSQQLLVNIFWPGSPMHDGAAIIQGDRLTRAGAILPLSQKTDLPPFFGTRHRAASGLAQVTDAMVIVVSEERGEISIFKDGEFKKVADAQRLEAILKSHTGDETVRRRFSQKAAEPVVVALISLACITGIWASFSKGMETFAEFDVPVEFINPDQKMEIVSSSSSKIRLMLSGARPLINSVRPEQINVKLNLSKAVVGSNMLSITSKNILLPPGIRLKNIEPQTLSVTLDALTEKQLYIQPNWTGKLPEGLVMTQAATVPETVTVRGGGLDLQDVTTLFTEEIALGRLTESGSLTVALVPGSPSVKLKGSGEVEVRFSISGRGSQ